LLPAGRFVTLVALDKDDAPAFSPFLAVVVAFWATWGPRLRNRRARLDVETCFVRNRRVVFVAQWPALIRRAQSGPVPKRAGNTPETSREPLA
jgi:hypothetical protein